MCNKVLTNTMIDDGWRWHKGRNNQLGTSGKRLRRVPRKRCHLRPAKGVGINQRRQLEGMKTCSESCGWFGLARWQNCLTLQTMGNLLKIFGKFKRIGFAFKEDLFGNRFLKVPYKFLHLVKSRWNRLYFPKDHWNNLRHPTCSFTA